MAHIVKPKRRYDSPRRREQAAATRADILVAAQRLFERDGYPSTTMAAIATEAGVALKTVYVAFATKSGVLRALWNRLLRGDPDDRPVADHPWYRAVLDESDPARQLKLNARNSSDGKVRVGKLAEVIRGAAAVDEDAAALWSRIQREYHANQQAIVESLEAKGGLRPELDVTTATDILWTINHPSTWQMLVAERGWSREQYEAWSADAAIGQLLRPRGRSSRSGPRSR
jgi:AcrR family transcriptional regulator